MFQLKKILPKHWLLYGILCACADSIRRWKMTLQTVISVGTGRLVWFIIRNYIILLYYWYYWYWYLSWISFSGPLTRLHSHMHVLKQGEIWRRAGYCERTCLTWERGQDAGVRTRLLGVVRSIFRLEELVEVEKFTVPPVDEILAPSFSLHLNHKPLSEKETHGNVHFCHVSSIYSVRYFFLKLTK